MYADDIHQDTHELGLTSDEETWGKHFWTETWRAGLAAPDSSSAYAERYAQELAAWQQLASRFGAARAAYIARLLEPTNTLSRPIQPEPRPISVLGKPVDPTGTVPPPLTRPKTRLREAPLFPANLEQRPTSWSRAAQARALPDRWLAIGSRAGQTSNTVWGALIPTTLATGLDPLKERTQANTNLKMPVDPDMLWMVDFDEAEAKGMGIRMQLTADEAAGGFDRLVVFGVKGTLSKKDGASELRALIEAHRFTWGCGFVPQGTPTNNTETVSAGYSREDVGFQTSFALEREERPNAGTDGARAALALGLNPADLAALRYADSHDQRDATNMNRALWPATIGYFLDQFLNNWTFANFRENRLCE
jgi:hypothetical protein